MKPILSLLFILNFLFVSYSEPAQDYEILKAKQLILKKDYDQALTVLKTVAQKDERQYYVWSMMAELYLHKLILREDPLIVQEEIVCFQECIQTIHKEHDFDINAEYLELLLYLFRDDLFENDEKELIDIYSRINQVLHLNMKEQDMIFLKALWWRNLNQLENSKLDNVLLECGFYIDLEKQKSSDFLWDQAYDEIAFGASNPSAHLPSLWLISEYCIYNGDMFCLEDVYCNANEIHSHSPVESAFYELIRKGVVQRVDLDL